jgi:(2S)-methylsuccinyl-CoA dehydrogenase
MSTAANRSAKEPELIGLIREATAVLDALLADATAKVRERVSSKGQVDGANFDREQRATHGLAWLATYVEAVRQLAATPSV